MWFRNLIVFQIKNWSIPDGGLEELLLKHRAQELSSLDVKNQGWVPPKEGEASLAYRSGQNILIALGITKKLLPTSVVNQYVQQQAEAFEEKNGHKPGRKLIKELKESVVQELLPRAFSLRSRTLAWVNPAKGWLVINTSSLTKADEFISFLRKSYDGFELSRLRTNLAPTEAMANWLIAEHIPGRFTIERNCELRSSNGEKSAVRYMHHAFTKEEIQAHLKSGKLITNLGITWNDRIYFELSNQYQFRKVTLLTVTEESSMEEDIFESEFALMTGEICEMLEELVDSMQGK